MFARPNARYTQVAYVTNGMPRAIATFCNDYGAPGFFEFSNFEAGVHEPGDPKVRIALSRLSGVEVEIIESVEDPQRFFSSVLPSQGFAIRLHHVAVRIQGPMDRWDAYAASINTAKHPIVFQGAFGEDMRFFYTDERARIGHYVEHVWMSEQLLANQAALIPTLP